MTGSKGNTKVAAATGDQASVDDARQRDEESAPLLQPGFQRTAATEVAVDIAPAGQASSCSHRSLSCSSVPDKDKVIGTCRICFEQETAESQDRSNPLICPCMCSGSSKYVHRQCLQQWRKTNHRADASYQCEVCKYRYRYQRLWWASILGHQVTLAIMFVLVMAASIAVLGYIPVTNDMFGKGSSSSSSSDPSPSPSPSPGGGGSGSSWNIDAPYPVIHLLNGLIMLGIVGLCLSLLLLCAAYCGARAAIFLPDTIWCPCMWCLECNGSGAPLMGEALAAGGGECCIAFGAVIAVMMLLVGLVTACYMLYGVIWLFVQSGLNRAQNIVENVQQGRERARGWAADKKEEGPAGSSSSSGAGEQQV